MSKIVVFLNGQAKQIPKKQSIPSLIKELNLAPEMILIEKNGEALLRGQWNETDLQHGDRLELVKVVAGG